MLEPLRPRAGDAPSAKAMATFALAHPPRPEVFVDERVREAARRLSGATGALAIILFGSRARGTAHAWSDWDLCVILPDDAPVERLTPFRLRPLTSDIGVPMDVVTIRKSVFLGCRDKHDSLSREVARDGRILLGSLEAV